jgi:transcriptional regulator with PAS, ATPase and Fis domain
VSYIRTKHPQTEIVVLATAALLDEATGAMRNGAAFYLIKPVPVTDLMVVLDKLAARIDRQQEYFELEQRVLADLMAGSSAMQKALKLAIKVAPTSSTILLGGESGSGKEFFARIIHRMSGRNDGHFVAMNCGAVPDTLFESELFGHRKGSFTGADRDKPGLVEEAHLGTLFLDEVGELSPPAQVKLLRFLQERSFRRIGENAMRSVNVRIIAATNRDPARMVQEGKLREDLFYRLNVFYLCLPPLRERKETIPNLVKLFVHRFNALFDKRVTRISKSAEVLLAGYDYPGNVRELENIIEHAVVLSDGNEITERELPEVMFRSRLLLSAPQQQSDQLLVITPLKDVEKRHIQHALTVLGRNYTEAAHKLGISRSTLWRKIKEYGLEPAGPHPDKKD